MKSLKFSKDEISGYIRNFNSVSTLLDPEFNERVTAFKDLLKEEEEDSDGSLFKYRRLLGRLTGPDGNQLSSTLIENEIIVEKQTTFRTYFNNLILELQEQTDSQENLTDEERD
jgi:hypothetical protein